MNVRPDSLHIPEPLRAQAAEWHVRLASETAEEADWLAFEAWLAESADHQRAYEALETLWEELDAARPQAAPEIAPGIAPNNVTPLRPRPPRRPAAWIPGAIAASLVAVVGAGLGWEQLQQPKAQSYATAVGERRVVALADGTRITLNGASQLTATLGRHERRVVMADAEAVFDVAKDPGRPFLIDAGDREIRVVGTEFNVLHHDGLMRVTVRRGIVEVRPAHTPSSSATRLTKGQALTHQEGQTGDKVDAADPNAAMAWTEGRLVFQGERLADVAETLNRYVKTPIVVDKDVRDLPVRATLVVGPEDDMLASLAAFLPVQSERRGDRMYLSLRR